MRKVTALVLALALQAAALAAPLVHAHPDDHTTAHHEGRAIHTHWADHAEPLHQPGSPEFAQGDHDRAVFLGAVVAVEVTGWSVAGTTVMPFVPPVPTERPAHRSLVVVRSHDPPFISSLSSRAPPALLS